MYAVVVTFEIKPDRMADFLPDLMANATTSLDQEPECQRFDVCVDPARPNEVFLYELYTDRAGFDAHLASEHFQRFDANVAPMIASKLARTYEQVHS